MRTKIQSGDRLKVVGYETGYFKDFQNKIVTVEKVLYDEVEKCDFLVIREFSQIEPFHLVKAGSFLKIKRRY